LPIVPPPAVPNCNERCGVASPITLAISWSIEMSLRKSTSDLSTWVQVRNAEVPPAWSPGPSGLAG
jgi:hypothetical protein